MLEQQFLTIYSKAPPLPIPHLRMRTHPPHPNPVLPPLILIPLLLRQRQLLWLLALLWVAVHERRRGTVIHLVNCQELPCPWECGCALLQVLRVQFLHMPVTYETRLVAHDCLAEAVAP